MNERSFLDLLNENIVSTHFFLTIVMLNYAIAFASYDGCIKP